MIRSTSASSLARREIYVPPDLSAMTADARKWYMTGVENAKRDLVTFGLITEKIEKGEDPRGLIKDQLRTVLTHVTDASDNTREMVPKLSYLVDSLFQWSRDPGWLDKLKLKGTVCFITGKRDNKSYYLQNGAGFWFKLRLDDYLKKIPQPNELAEKLVKDFENLEDKVLLARDTLDDMAQLYVKDLAQLVPLVSDVGKNAEEIRKVVDHMKSTMEEGRPAVIATAEESVKLVKEEIDSL